MVHKIFSFILVLFLIVAGSDVTGVKAETKEDGVRFDILLKYGYRNEIEKGKAAPFEITVKNNGDDFEGSVQILTYKSNEENAMYEKQLALSKGQEKSVALTIDTEGISNKLKIRLVNKKGKVVFSKEESLYTAKGVSAVNIGVLSDDASGLAYASGKSFQEEKMLITSLVVFNKDTLQEDAGALDMIDVMLISDYSTDMLTDKQLEAVFTWVKNGGLLLIGTGSTASKTLSGLSGYLNIEIGEMQTYDTKFGLSFLDFSYPYMQEQYLTSSAYGKDLEYIYETTRWQDYSKEVEAGDYQAFFEAYYEKNAEFLMSTAWSSYFSNYYDWYLKNAKEKLETMEVEFKEFCYNELLREYYNEFLVNSKENNYKEIADIEYVTADILDFTVENGGYVIQGEIKESEETFKLMEVLTYGLGQVVVAGFDFTKSPFVSYSKANTFVFIDVIERLKGAELYQEIIKYTEGKYHGGISYSLRYLGEMLASLNAPPVLLYLIILTVYLAGGVILYKLLKKKNRTMLLWPAQVGLALFMSLVVYLSGFTTKVTSPKLDIARINLYENGRCTENNIVTVTIPGTDSEEFEFLEEYSYEYISKNGYNRYEYTGDLENPDFYKVGYLDRAGVTGVEIANQKAMDLSYMRLAKTDNAESVVDLDVIYKPQSLTGTATNNSGKDLENAFIFTGDAIYYIGDMKQGETVDLSVVKAWQARTNNSYQSFGFTTEELSKVIFPGENGVTPAMLLLGSSDKEFRKYYNRTALFSYCFGEYMASNITLQPLRFSLQEQDIEELKAFYPGLTDEEIMNKVKFNVYAVPFEIGFAAFPAESDERSVQAAQKYDENITEIIVCIGKNKVIQ